MELPHLDLRIEIGATRVIPELLPSELEAGFQPIVCDLSVIHNA